MDQYLQRIFLREVQRQVDFSAMALDDMKRALDDGPISKLWFGVQSFLIAVGNISKLLWPLKEFEQRGSILRTLLKVPDDSPLALRTFRNHFEHFDERLEEWATASTGRMFVDSNVGSPNWIDGPDHNAYLRNFDRLNSAITFGSDQYMLEPVVRAIDSLRENLRQIEASVLDGTDGPGS